MSEFDPIVESSVGSSTGIGTDNSTDAGSSGTGGRLKLSSRPELKTGYQPKVSSDSRNQKVSEKVESVRSSLSCGTGNENVNLRRGVGGSGQMNALFAVRNVALPDQAFGNFDEVDPWRVSALTTDTVVPRNEELAPAVRASYNNDVNLSRDDMAKFQELRQEKQKRIDENALASCNGVANDAKKESSTSSFLSILSEWGKAGLKSLFDAPINAFFGLMGLMGFGVGSSEAGKAAHATVHNSAGEESASGVDSVQASEQPRADTITPEVREAGAGEAARYQGVDGKPAGESSENGDNTVKEIGRQAVQFNLGQIRAERREFLRDFNVNDAM